MPKIVKYGCFGDTDMYPVKEDSNIELWVKWDDVKNLIKDVEATCNCSKCLSARAGYPVKSIDDYYKD
jgi:hypothetical protein